MKLGKDREVEKGKKKKLKKLENWFKHFFFDLFKFIESITTDEDKKEFRILIDFKVSDSNFLEYSIREV